jgi:hypothetical protein
LDVFSERKKQHQGPAMQKIEQRISQAGFARMQESLLSAELAGYGPDACAAMALTSVGLSPRYGVETVLVVDPKLNGPIYPFMAWPAELAAQR